jgi:hypothetical protein
VIGIVICIGGTVLMSLYKGEVLLVWSSSNMQPDYVVLIQPFRSLTVCFGTNVASMLINKFQLGYIFFVLTSILWVVSTCRWKTYFAFQSSLFLKSPLMHSFPLPFPFFPSSIDSQLYNKS